MNIVEAYKALQEGKRVEDHEGDEVTLDYRDKMKFKESDITEDNIVPLTRSFLAENSFRLIKSSKTYYRLEEGRFTKSSESDFKSSLIDSEILENKFNMGCNDDILTLVRTEYGNYDIWKIVEDEE